MTGSHSRLGTSDRESRTTGVIRAYDTVAGFVPLALTDSDRSRRFCELTARMCGSQISKVDAVIMSQRVLWVHIQL